MIPTVHLVPPELVLPLRTRQRDEAGGQLVHDSLHRRQGWTQTHRMDLGDEVVGFASVAVGGPWTGRPTLYEFYVVPEFRHRAFEVFEAFLAVAGAGHFEIQSSETLATGVVLAHARDIASEKVVFRDGVTTHLTIPQARLRARTDPAELRVNVERRQGGGEWDLEVAGRVVATGGLLFHYNRPYGDVYMEVKEAHRRLGFGGYLVQELKRECHALGALPAARCSTQNHASRRTLQKAGFVPWAHILHGVLAGPAVSAGPSRRPDTPTPSQA